MVTQGKGLNLGDVGKAVAPVATKEANTLTVRELIAELVRSTDMDAEVHLSIFNMDPTPIVVVDESEDGQVVLSNVS